MTKVEADGAEDVVVMRSSQGGRGPKDPTYSVFMEVPSERVEELARELELGEVMILIEARVSGQGSREGAIDHVRLGLQERERYGTFAAALTGALQTVVREDPDTDLRASIMAEFRQMMGDVGDDELYKMADRAIKASRHDV